MQFDRKEVVVFVISIVLGLAGLVVDDIPIVALLLFSAAAVGCYAATVHKGLSVVFRLLVCISILTGAVGLFLRMYNQHVAKVLQDNEGILSPDHRITPSTARDCGMPGNALAVHLGSVVAWTTKTSYDILDIDGQSVLGIEQNLETGAVRITNLELYDDRHDRIAHIDEKGFWVSPSARRIRPDLHTLIIFDHADTEALSVNLLDDHTIYILGRFRSLSGKTVDVLPDMVISNGLTLSSFCVGNAGHTALVFR